MLQLCMTKGKGRAQETPYLVVVAEGAGEGLDALCALFFDLGSLGIEEREDGIRAYFGSDMTADGLARSLDEITRSIRASGLRAQPVCRIEGLEAVDWTREWKKGLNPILIGESLVIVAPWHEYCGPQLKVVIAPGMAFGTGHHATTMLCLQEIEAFAKSRTGSFLDIGTGTGILAISAALLGFKPVCVTDTDPVCVEIAEKNFKVNGVDQVRFLDPSLDGREECFSLIACNLTLEPIKSLLARILGLRSRDGAVILSGLLEGQEEAVIALLGLHGIEQVKTVCLDGWAALVF